MFPSSPEGDGLSFGLDDLHIEHSHVLVSTMSVTTANLIPTTKALIASSLSGIGKEMPS
jgi:hypothetical protein